MCKQQETSLRQCVVCNRQLYGRSDKRFCDIHCKNAYHSEVRKSFKAVQIATTKILVKNLVVLTGLLGEGNDSCLIEKLALEKLGFRFDYVTDVVNRHGRLHYGIFNLSYRWTDKKRILITLDRDRNPVSPFVFKRWNKEIEAMRMRV